MIIKNRSIMPAALLMIALVGSVRAESSSAEKSVTDQANIVLMHARAGKSEALGNALRELLAHTRKEPGCALIELHQSVDDPDMWMVYERWRGKEALASHMKQAYVTSFLSQLNELSDRPAVVNAYTPRP